MTDLRARISFLKTTCRIDSMYAMQQTEYCILTKLMGLFSDIELRSVIQHALMKLINEMRRASHYKSVSFALFFFFFFGPLTGLLLIYIGQRRWRQKVYPVFSPRLSCSLNVDLKRDNLLEPPLSFEDCLDAVEKFPTLVTSEKLEQYDIWTRDNKRV